MTAQQLYKVTPQIYVDRFKSTLVFYLRELHGLELTDDVLTTLSWGERKELIEACCEETRRLLGISDLEHRYYKDMARKAFLIK